MGSLIALGIVGTCIAVLTFALLLVAAHDTEPGSDAFKGWFPSSSATDMK